MGMLVKQVKKIKFSFKQVSSLLQQQKKVADGPSTLANKRKNIPTSGSLFRKPSSVDMRTRMV